MGALRHLTPLLALPLALAACRDAKVALYRVPKEKDPELPVASAPAAGPALTWTAPAEWRAKPASAMRKGSYAVPGEGGVEADLSITAFPGDVGGELANVNRWRGQVQLPPLGEADLGGAISHVAQNGLPFTLADFAAGNGSKSQRILGAIVPYADSTWFFKLTGPDALVAKSKPDFLAFLKTVKPGAQP